MSTIYLPKLYLPKGSLTLDWQTVSHSAFWGRKNLSSTRDRSHRKLQVTYVYTPEEFRNADIDNNLLEEFVVPLFFFRITPHWMGGNSVKLGTGMTAMVRMGDRMYVPFSSTGTPTWETVGTIDNATGTCSITSASATPSEMYPCITGHIENRTRMVKRDRSTGHITEEITFVED